VQLVAANIKLEQKKADPQVGFFVIYRVLLVAVTSAQLPLGRHQS
jgi:hypothetical protein